MQILSSLKRFPTPRHWAECVVYSFLFGAVAVIVMPDLIDLKNSPSVQELLPVAVAAFVIPALGEELFFRGLLTPRFTATWAIISTSLFVMWHPLETLFLLPAAGDLFTNPRFLSLVALLGLVCWFAYFRSRSLWASIFIHWIVVVGWKALGGARFLI